MRKISINVPDAVADQLEKWANQEGRTLSHLCNFLLEKGVADAEEVGVLAPRIPVVPQVAEQPGEHGNERKN